MVRSRIKLTPKEYIGAFWCVNFLYVFVYKWNAQLSLWSNIINEWEVLNSHTTYYATRGSTTRHPPSVLSMIPMLFALFHCFPSSLVSGSWMQARKLIQQNKMLRFWNMPHSSKGGGENIHLFGMGYLSFPWQCLGQLDLLILYREGKWFMPFYSWLNHTN